MVCDITLFRFISLLPGIRCEQRQKKVFNDDTINILLLILLVALYFATGIIGSFIRHPSTQISNTRSGDD